MPDKKLLFVRIHLGKQKMDVGVEDRSQDKGRIVEYEWKTKEPSDVPPEKWYDTVVGEIAYQRAEDLKKASGRYIPGV